jgi:hypothetical protein
MTKPLKRQIAEALGYYLDFYEDGPEGRPYKKYEWRDGATKHRISPGFVTRFGPISEEDSLHQLPDWDTSFDTAFALMPEGLVRFTIAYLPVIRVWECDIQIDAGTYVESGETAAEAVCKTWLAWKRREE